MATTKNIIESIYKRSVSESSIDNLAASLGGYEVDHAYGAVCFEFDTPQTAKKFAEQLTDSEPGVKVNWNGKGSVDSIGVKGNLVYVGDDIAEV